MKMHPSAFISVEHETPVLSPRCDAHALKRRGAQDFLTVVALATTSVTTALPCAKAFCAMS